MTARRPLLLVGAGGLAREVLATVRARAAAAADAAAWEVVGLLDDNPDTHGRIVDGVPVIGPIDAVADRPEAFVTLCTASTRNQASRKLISDRLALPAERYATIVHPVASIAAGTDVGAGTVAMAGVVVTAPQRIGAHVVLMPQVTLTHDDEVDDFATFAARVALAGSVSVGQGAYLGSGALVREGLKVGAWSLVGMGSVVLRDVPESEVWAGNPARRLRP